MTAERNSLEAALQSEKAYVRRLEHKMTAGGPDTAARCAQLRSKLKTARDELQVETAKTRGLQKELEEERMADEVIEEEDEDEDQDIAIPSTTVLQKRLKQITSSYKKSYKPPHKKWY